MRHSGLSGNLALLDGLSVKDGDRMPQPVDLFRWSAAGLYRIDVDLGVFRLTEKGRRAITLRTTSEETTT